MSSGSSLFTIPFVDGKSSMAIGIALPIVCAIAVGVRYWTRYIQKARIGTDDWLILAALIWVIGMGICFIDGAAKRVFGYASPPIPPNLTPDEQFSYISPQYELIEKLQFPFQIFLVLAYGCIKMSVVAFYRRLFVVDQRGTFGIVSLVTQVVIFLWTIAFLLLIIFPCGKHIWANWANTPAQLEFCSVVFTSEYGLTESDLILDVYIFLMPLPMIWGLRLTTAKKFAVSGILLLGASAIGASIARLISYVQGVKALTDDPTVDANQVVTVGLWWSLLECGLALIAACLPTFSFLFRHLTFQSALNSLRNVFSLGSVNSNSGSRSRTRSNVVESGSAHYIDLEARRVGSQASDQKMFDKSSMGSEVVMQDL